MPEIDKGDRRPGPEESDPNNQTQNALRCIQKTFDYLSDVFEAGKARYQDSDFSRLSEIGIQVNDAGALRETFSELSGQQESFTVGDLRALFQKSDQGPILSIPEIPDFNPDALEHSSSETLWPELPGPTSERIDWK